MKITIELPDSAYYEIINNTMSPSTQSAVFTSVQNGKLAKGQKEKYYRCKDGKREKSDKPRFQYICYDENEMVEASTDTLDEMAYYLGISESAVHHAITQTRKQIGKPRRRRTLVRLEVEE